MGKKAQQRRGTKPPSKGKWDQHQLKPGHTYWFIGGGRAVKALVIRRRHHQMETVTLRVLPAWLVTWMRLVPVLRNRVIV